MNSRNFRKRVEIWTTTAVPDTYGGNTLTETLLDTRWANIESVSANSYVGKQSESFGLIDATNNYKFTFRLSKDLNYDSVIQFLKYQGVKYIITSDPLNVNFDNSLITIFATREAHRTTNEIPSGD